MDEQTSLFQGHEPAPALQGLWALEVTGPASWPAARSVWELVQQRWAWPAPALAVNGRDGFLLVFRWPAADGVAPQAQAPWTALLAGLAADLAADLAVPHAVAAPAFRLWPLASLPSRLPPHEVLPDQWAAFVTRDLAPIFADTPWLDVCPGGQAQAEHVARLKAVDGSAWAAFLAQAAQLGADPVPAALHGGAASALVPSGDAGRGACAREANPLALDGAAPLLAGRAGPANGGAGGAGEASVGNHVPKDGDPLGRHEARLWLLAVMHDDSQSMVHRLEAARLLLAH